MKHLILSADNTPSLYLVPEDVTNNLDKHLKKFWEWMQTNPNAEKYRIDCGNFISICYNESDFIQYLNTWIFPDQPAQLIEAFDEYMDIPEKYKHIQWFNF